MNARFSSAKKDAASAADEQKMRGDPTPGLEANEDLDVAAIFRAILGADVEVDESAEASGSRLPS